MGRRREPNKTLFPSTNISPGQMKRTQAEVLEMGGGLPTLDLHGKTVREAQIALNAYIDLMAREKQPFCSVVFGKGSGTLSHVVRELLEEYKESDLIESYYESQKFPGAAVLIIFDHQ